MKLGLLLLATLPIAAYAQDSITVNTSNQYPNTFSSGSANIQKIDNKARRFNDWSISVGGGAAFMTNSDLTSFYDKKVNWGYNTYVSIDKQYLILSESALCIKEEKRTRKVCRKALVGC